MSEDTAAYAPLVDGIEIHCPAYFVACACVKGKKFFSMNAFPWMYAEPPTTSTDAWPEWPPSLSVIRWLPSFGPTSPTIRIVRPGADVVLT